ncbi:3,4-dihydroxy-2-butanone-4-phosphate synthase [Geodermatophilus sp. SYSU D00703]
MTAVLPPRATLSGREGSRLSAGADPVERVRAALADVAAGRPVVLVGDDGAGDLAFAAELATPQLLAFVVRHTAGFVCVAVPEADADRLDLPLMVAADRDRPGAAQCVAVDAAAGTGTGISATDRSTTIRLLAAPDSGAADLVRPGHVVPVRVRPGGVFGTRGRAEAAADLAGLAGLRPSAGRCELVSTVDPGGTARGAMLERFAREHGLALVSVGDLVAYRVRFEGTVERGASTALPPAAGGSTAVRYRDRTDGGEHLALVHGDLGDGEDVLVHVHRECLAGDPLGAALCDCGEHLRSAVAGVAGAGRGVVVHLRRTAAGAPHDRDVAAQIMRDLGVRSSRPVSGVPGRPCPLGATPTG